MNKYRENNRISPQAISKARELGYNEDTLKECEINMNSLEAQDCVVHRGVYDFLKDNGSRMDNDNYNANCDIIHYFENKQADRGENFIKFHRPL